MIQVQSIFLFLPIAPSSMVCILATDRLTLSGAASAPGISPHGDGLSVRLDILKVLKGAGELPAVDGLGSLASVLERNTEVRATGAGGLGGLELGGSVTDLSREDELVDCDCGDSVESVRIGQYHLVGVV